MDLELLKIIIYLLTGGFLIFLAVTITRDNFISRLNRLAGALLFFAGLGPVFLAVGALLAPTATPEMPFGESTAYHLHHFWAFFFPVLLAFSWSYPTDHLKGFRFQWLRYAVFIPQIMQVFIGLFAADIVQSLIELEATISKEGFLSVLLSPLSYAISFLHLFVDFIRTYQVTIFGCINLFYTGLAIWFLESGRRFVTDPRLLTQTKIIFWGMRVGLGLYGISLFELLFMPESFPQVIHTLLLILGPLAGAAAFAYAIVRYQFLDVRLVFRQSLVYTFTSAVLVGLYVLAILKAKEFLIPVFGDRQAEIISYLFIVFLLLVFQPVSSWIDNVIRSMFMRTRTDYRNIVERFSRQIISVFDPKQLIQIIEETMKTALLVERVYFVLYDDSIREYAIIPSNDNPDRHIVARDDLMLRGINLLDSPTPFESLGDYKADSELAGHLKERRVRLILPMKDADHLLGFLALTSKVAGYLYTAEDYNLLGVLSNQMVSALTNARLYVESLERIRLQEEVNMARQIQVNLLPAEPPCLDCYDVAAASTPSRTVGGDFYDFIHIDGDDRIGVVIADASGKGMPAALMIAQIQAIIRSELHSGNSISMMLKNMNQQMAESSAPETYVTLFYGELDAIKGVFHYANAGHNHPILVRKDGSHRELEVGGPIIGAFPNMDYSSSSVRLEPEDVLFLFTDGLSEAMDEQEVEYGETKIREMVIANRHNESNRIMGNILDDVLRFDPTSPPKDDTTVITMKVRDRDHFNNV